MIKKLLLAIMIAFPMSLFAQKFGVINTHLTPATSIFGNINHFENLSFRFWRLFG